jgi:hypothetical protein
LARKKSRGKTANIYPQLIVHGETMCY